jgi:predicted HNH restriction endonuclease
MALVHSLEPNSKERQTVHEPTRCLYAVVTGQGGNRYLQLDTLGSQGREIPDKVSQSIQFDRQAAGQLLQLIRQTFPDLAGGETAPSASNKTPGDAEEEGVEGRARFKLHLRRERIPGLVRAKKKAALATAGRLLCEVCEFDFAVFYGPIGEGFAECHHRIPVAKLDGTIPTRLSDLAIVCSNCHRILHRRPYHTVGQLQTLVQAYRIAAAKGER